MNRSATLFALALGACTTPVYDESRFEASATHIDRSYQRPLDRLYACFMERDVAPIGLKSLYQGWSFPDRAFYGSRGMTAVRFTRVSDRETKVRISVLVPFDPHWSLLI